MPSCSMVQLKGNLMPARGLPGEHTWVNLQTGAGLGAGARNQHSSPTPGTHFDQVSYINTLILTIVRATFAALFIHSSL